MRPAEQPSTEPHAVRSALTFQSMLGTAQGLPNELSRVLDGAMTARLLRSAQDAGIVGEGLDVIETLLIVWSEGAPAGSAEIKRPLCFEVDPIELAALVGWPLARTSAVLNSLFQAGLLAKAELSDDPWSVGNVAVDLTPLLARVSSTTANALRRLWSVRHFRDLHDAWLRRADQLHRIFSDVGSAERFEGVEELAAELQQSWTNLSDARDFLAIAGLFERPWANSERIYTLFAELVAFDDEAWVITRRFGLTEPLSRVLYEHAGMRAQVRRDRMLGYAPESVS